MIFNPKYFYELCSKIMDVFTDEEINTQIRLRALRTINVFTILNNKMATWVLKYLELNKLLILLYSYDSRGCTDIISLLTNWCTWDKSDQNLHHLINDISNIHKIQLTRPRLETFMSFIANQSIIDKEECSNFFMKHSTSEFRKKLF